ncbi:glutamyl-tRNA(Gln) amidotransferase subunit A [Clostridium aceticum]|uniref:Glutamyl-tRNA(Gln) amidotransferase subunit A n=1 Tax=Clostridium aceticum TaxID=84022 RepID=A0A0D8I8E0_9CLOT|nr:Asp-tRNA(Asn)/Glu-tRNA(Gln) amidotransferase subunit GatA [Clostridium aceticum]AKL95861.1 glutamyl-tRNA(Gln) amidotransferase subunit A [Clostridium aceticum]KJF26550.1 glutamyl-tRNA amidotransferase [Clostridium aceticum]
MKIHEMTIEEIKEGYSKKAFTVKEVVKAYYERIADKEEKVNALITLCEEEALRTAEEMDQKLEKGEALGLLGGIPVVIKDNICTKGIATTCASKMLQDFIPPYDATIVEKLKEAGAIIIGKANMDEFAMGSSTENSAFKTTRNPWHLQKVPGGSSGGSAAALAAGFAPLTIGSDTGGSIRQPAAFCGVVGLKPTYGLISRYGLIAFASSLDQIGPFGKTVKDCSLALQVMQGKDPMDATSYQGGYTEDYMVDLEKKVTGLKIGLPKEFFQEGLDEEIHHSIKEAIKLLEEMGAVVEEFSLPIVDTGLSAYYILSSAEASSNLARYDGVRYGYRPEAFEGIQELMMKSRTKAFGKEVKRRIMLGTYVLSSGYYDAYYKKAMMMKEKIRATFKEAFAKYDVILSPTSPVLPFGVGEKTEDPLEMYLSDIYTVNINIAGLPAITIPCGFSKSKLPIGLQLIGDHYAEKKLLTVAHQLEQAIGIHKEAADFKEV